MTPKEKAKEFYCKYADMLNVRDLQTNANLFAKQCALIAVDEIISEYEVLLIETNFCHKMYLYWKDVKQEIQLL